MANPQQSDNAIWFSIRHLLIGVVVVAILITAARYSIRTYNSLFQPFEDFSAIWLTHDMLTMYLSQTNGEWPDTWADLEPIFTPVNTQSYGVPDLDWVRHRITIDFDVDLTAVAADNDEHDHQVHAIRQADGTENEETRSANDRLASAILNWTLRAAPTQGGT